MRVDMGWLCCSPITAVQVSWRRAGTLAMTAGQCWQQQQHISSVWAKEGIPQPVCRTWRIPSVVGRCAQLVPVSWWRPAHVPSVALQRELGGPGIRVSLPCAAGFMLRIAKGTDAHVYSNCVLTHASHASLCCAESWWI